MQLRKESLKKSLQACRDSNPDLCDTDAALQCVPMFLVVIVIIEVYASRYAKKKTSEVGIKNQDILNYNKKYVSL